MTDRLERAYRRLGPRYLDAFVGFYLTVSAGLGLVANLIFTLFVETSLPLFLLTVAVSELCLLVPMLWGARAWLRAVRPVTSWLRDGRSQEQAPAAWRAAITAPRRGVIIQAWRSVVFTAIPLTGFVAVAYDLAWPTAILLAIGVLAAATYPTTLFFLLTEQVMRPVVLDAAQVAAADVPAEGGISMRAKVLIVLPLVGVITSGFTSVVTTARTGGDLDDLGVSILAGLGVTATASLVLTIMLARSITAPVQDLLEVTRRVAEGDRHARAPIVGGDEVGRLSASFNAMIGAVAEREELHERAIRAEADAERATAAERARIARELHDSVSHAMTMVVLQADAALLTMDDQPDRARLALRQIEDTGRSALGELRRFLGILRAPGEDAALAPAPRLSELAAVCERLEQAGVSIEAHLPASVRWPPDLELAAFRIGQEALTNVLKHADARHVQVRIGERDDAVEIEVVDDGRGPGGAGGSRGGHGILGMRERAALHGGRVQAGAGPDGRGFAVHARLPLDSRAPAARRPPVGPQS